MKQELKIALVESSRYHARLLAGELAERLPGSSISVFGCGQAALGELRRRCFDIAIIGLDLPDVDGVGFIKLLRRDVGDLPIIAVGDSNGKGPRKDAIAFGANDFYARDVSRHENLVRMVNKLCRTSRRKPIRPEEKNQIDLIRVTAGTLRHEINNPLMTILGVTELILDNGYQCDREVTRKLRIVRRSAQRIHTALSRLSRISQPEIRDTPIGKLIDPRKSTVTGKS
ncbi:MAG: response regulator [bacterium]